MVRAAVVEAAQDASRVCVSPMSPEFLGEIFAMAIKSVPYIMITIACGRYLAWW